MGKNREKMESLSSDLTHRFGRGYSRQNLQQMRQFYLTYPPYPPGQICQTPSGESQIVSAESALQAAADRFSLPWSAYVRLLSLKSEDARRFYETEALAGGWSVRQLDRQINSQFYERTALSRGPLAANGSIFFRKIRLPRPLLPIMNLLDRDRPDHAAILLFGKEPQRFLVTSE